MGSIAIDNRDQAGRWSLDERYQQLVELAPDGILVHDSERITLANSSAVRLVGATSRSELVGQPIDSFLDPPWLKAVEEQLADGAAGGEGSSPVRDRLHRLDGTDLEVEVRAVAFVDHGRPSAHLVLRDVTHRLELERIARDAEEQLRRAQRLQSIGVLAGGVAHEVNNKMQVVLGYCSFLLDDPRVPPESLSDLGEIIRAANHASKVSRQLLDFSRRAIHRPELIDVAAAVRISESMVRELVGDSCTVTVVADAPVFVWADRRQLEQAVVNLSLNGCEAMPAGGTLTISAVRMQVGGGTFASDGEPIPPGAYATMQVADTGRGMEAEVMERIFEPFFTTKEVGHGVGLGLAAVHGALRQNHGYIKVASIPRQGSCFTIFLPALPFGGTEEAWQAKRLAEPAGERKPRASPA